MNIFAIIILIALVINLIIDIVADYLNLKQANTQLPDEFKDVYDTDRYQESQKYLRINTKFSWIHSAFSTLLLLGFWFFKGFPFLDNLISSFGYTPVVTGVLYIGTIVLIKSILSIPFSIYSTFVIESDFGFNNTTVKTYISDLIKSIILGVLLGVPLLAGILYFFEYAGNLAWIFCWATVTIVMLLLNYIVPTWIMPLFNKFEPVEEGELKSAIMNYAESIDFSLENIFKMDGSKRSSKSNAFFTGFGKNKRIVLFDTLIEKHTVPELVAVLAHEMGHFKRHHILKTMIAGILQMGIVFFIMSVCLTQKGLFEAFYMEKMSVYAGLIFFGMLYAPVDMLTGIVFQIFSRKNEYEADRFAVDTTQDSQSMISTLKKLSADNLGNLTPHPFYVFLNYSHPPVLNRINSISSQSAEGHTT